MICPVDWKPMVHGYALLRFLMNFSDPWSEDARCFKRIQNPGPTRSSGIVIQGRIVGFTEQNHTKPLFEPTNTKQKSWTCSSGAQLV